MKWLTALFTDGEWASDLTKVAGLALLVVAVIGWFHGRDPSVLIGFGSGLVASGKFSKQG
jgi:hypothetical protein